MSAGLWSADISLEVQDCFSDNQIAVDVCAAEILAIIKMKLPARGVYGCRIEFEIVGPTASPLKSVCNSDWRIEGLIEVRGVRLQRIASSAEAD